MTGQFLDYDVEGLRRLVERVAGEVAGFLRDRFGEPGVGEVVGRHAYDDDESIRADVEAERLAIELLVGEGVRGSVVTEERGLVKLGDEPLLFVLDPLDGSRNYASRIPWYAVSIAVAPLSREVGLADVVAGAVAPGFGLVFSFARGVGAFEGGSRVSCRGPRRPVVLAYYETASQARLVEAYRSRMPGRSIRVLGSSSLEIVWASMGVVEVFMDLRGRLRTVDVAAALGFALEAGARVALGNPSASLVRLERVGPVIVSCYEDAWSVATSVVEGVREFVGGEKKVG